MKLDYNADANGTHRVGEIEASYKDLERCFGEPMEGDGYKVSGEWIFSNDNGDVFTLYDWKSTRLYDRTLPSIKEFRKQSSATFNIGGRTDPKEFKAYLTRELAKKK